MATTFSTLHPAFPFRVPVSQPLQFGHIQESLFRTLLAELPGLQVVYDASADAIYKLDAVVWCRDKPLLPAVGVQFTLKLYLAVITLKEQDIKQTFELRNISAQGGLMDAQALRGPGEIQFFGQNYRGLHQSNLGKKHSCPPGR